MADATATPGGGSGGDEASSVEQAKALAGLRRVLLSVRKEKDLVEARLSGASHQASLKEQLAAHLRRELDEARAELKRLEEGEGGGGAGGGAAALHAKLLAQLEENQLFRESNASLRSEANRLAAALKEAEAAGAALKGELAPLRQQASALGADKAALEAEAADLKATSASWQARVEALTHKYKVVDPEDHARALAELTAAKAAVEAERSAAAASASEASAELGRLGAALRRELAEEQARGRDAATALAALRASAEADREAGVRAAEAARAKADALQAALDAATKGLADAEARHSVMVSQLTDKYDKLKASARGLVDKKTVQIAELTAALAAAGTAAGTAVAGAGAQAAVAAPAPVAPAATAAAAPAPAAATATPVVTPAAAPPPGLMRPALRLRRPPRRLRRPRPGLSPGPRR